MKKTLFVLILICACLGTLMNTAAAETEKELEGTLTLSGAWAIYPTAVEWAATFQKSHPKVKVDVSAGGAGKGAADAIAGLVDIGMVSREPDPSEIEKGITPVYVLHDAVFPVISQKNPAGEKIRAQGIKKEFLTGMYITETVTKWDHLYGDSIGKSVHVYTRSDSCGAAASWAAYFGKKQEDLKGIGVYGDPGLLEAARRDPLGIGYTNFSYVFTRDGKIVEGVAIAPIDANQNGVADPDEVYATRGQAVQAIEAGKYPVTRKNYFFVKGKPKGLALAFIQFTLSEEGSRIVNDVGASLPLPTAEREKVLKGLA
ncbi:MAG: substrate-binding domain-containing protein [Candidatus Omnitrophica bacterium]|nr:substrate-binding domain-containing protein [Candidatus Omnitrophota bacterium]